MNVKNSRYRTLIDGCQILKKNSKVSATKCEDAVLVYSSCQVKQVSDVRKATAGKKKKVWWQVAVGNCEGRRAW